MSNNAKRIEWAAEALAAYIDSSGDDHTALVDLLADLRHWADYADVDFYRALETSYEHYSAERIEP